jgi:hypothetical protein
LDVLVALSDELSKMDNNVEHVTRKIANQLFDLLENEANKNDALTVNNSEKMFNKFFLNFTVISCNRILPDILSMG